MALPDSNYANLAAAAIPNPGATTDTTITISATNGATFPNTPFFATIMPTDGVANSTNSEIVEVTAASTSGANTTFTVTRAQRNTSAISWNANEAVIAHAVYTEDVTPLQDAAFIDDTIGTQTNDAYVGTNNIQDGAVTTAKIADYSVDSTKIDFTSTSFSDNGVSYQKFGKIVIGTVSFAPSSAVSMTNYDANPYLITTLDAAPSTAVSVPVWAMNASNGAVGFNLFLLIDTSGRVYIRNFTATTVSVNRLRASFSFISS